MASVHSDQATGSRIPIALKILVAGGFGVGKTTLVASCSEILPLQTEEMLTDASIGIARRWRQPRCTHYSSQA